ncbi:MAG: GGDEF domain-containing protein [Mycobacterium sp.]
MRILGDGPPDQYYAITSSLTARGHQQTTVRVVAGCILSLSLPATLAAANPRISEIPGGRSLLAIVPLACVILASPWLRHRWPTRGQSTTVVIVGTLLLAAGSIVVINPFSGLLTATAFPFVLGYAALFHGTRVQVFVAAIAAGTVLWLTIQIAKDDVPTALAVATPVILINVAVFVACRTIAQVAAPGYGSTDVEPLTGLLTRESFDEQAATLLGARNRGDDRYLVLAVTTIDSFAAVLSLQGRRGADRVRIAAAQALRDTVRRDALVGHVADGEFLVADTFTTPDPTPLGERIRSAVTTTGDGITASIGVVCTPLQPLADLPPLDVLDEVIALATTAMYRARRQGGNQVDYILNPALSGSAAFDPEPDEI